MPTLAPQASLNLIHLVSAQHDRDVLADPCEVSVPVGHVFVRDAARHVEHDDRALPLDAALVGRQRGRKGGRGGEGENSNNQPRNTNNTATARMKVVLAGERERGHVKRARCCSKRKARCRLLGPSHQRTAVGKRQRVRRYLVSSSRWRIFLSMHLPLSKARPTASSYHIDMLHTQ